MNPAEYLKGVIDKYSRLEKGNQLHSGKQYLSRYKSKGHIESFIGSDNSAPVRVAGPYKIIKKKKV